MTTIASFSTVLHPCAIETLTLEGDHSIIACGCYELDESSQHRNGSIVFYHCDDSSSMPTIREFTSAIDCPAGVLDLKVTRKYVCAALASETLQFYELPSVNKGTEIEISKDPVMHITREGEGLFLSVDCYLSSNSNTGDPKKFAVSTQSGSVVVYDTTNTGLVEEAHIPSAHVMFGENMPAWMVVWNPHSEFCLVSGGDDCAFRLWDTRHCGTPQITNKKHTAGVTSARFHNEDSNILLTGSYDESCMFWDIRNFRSPLQTIKTGGGVWRTKWVTPSDSKYEYLATANMQGGSNIYQIDMKSLDSIQIVNTGRYTDNMENHLAYGLGVIRSTVIPIQEKFDIEFLTASCTFYDSKIYWWTTSLPFEIRIPMI